MRDASDRYRRVAAVDAPCFEGPVQDPGAVIVYLRLSRLVMPLTGRFFASRIDHIGRQR